MATTTVQAAPTTRPGPTHVQRARTQRLPWWWRELGLLGAVYVVYSIGRLVVGADSGAAMGNAAQIVTI